MNYMTFILLLRNIQIIHIQFDRIFIKGILFRMNYMTFILLLRKIQIIHIKFDRIFIKEYLHH